MLTVKQGDTHQIWFIVRDCDGNPIDLTDTAVVVRAKQTGKPVVTLAVSAIPPLTDGRLEHILTGTLAPGPWTYEIELERSGLITTAPTKGTGSFLVQAQMG